MKTLKIENKLNLVNDNTWILVKVICPKINIQKMLESTEGRFISKKEIALNYNHHAGTVFEVTIKARFSKVECYLKSDSIYGSDNYEAYSQMTSINGYMLGNCLTNQITSLYAFGDCSELVNWKELAYTKYFRIDGYSILRQNTDFTEKGNKRYIKTNKCWMSNKKY